MCGIAGYNMSPKFCSEHITSEEVQKDILQEAWLHNQHRGYDAAGYFSVNDKDRVTANKKGLDAASIITEIEEKERTIPVGRVFGAHTRATTQGTEKDNRNNHPVIWGGTYVTHNGTIRNDDDWRKLVGKKSRDKLPAVDTVALNIAMLQMNPFDPDDAIEVLSEINGAFAFHGYWKNHPGVSLLVRGNSSPLIIAYNGKGALLYASVEEALYGMINAMGLDHKDKDWTFRTMDLRQAMLIRDGEPVWFKSIPHKHWVSGNRGWKPDFDVVRLLPSKDGDIEVFKADMQHDWAVKARDQWSALDPKDPEQLSLLYGRVTGFEDEKKSFPMTNDIQTFSILSEADQVFRNADTDCLHAFYGETEIVMSNTGRTIKDVFNHAVIKNEDRWRIDMHEEEEEEEKKDEVNEPQTFQDFLMRKSTEVRGIPADVPKYDYLKGHSNVIYLGSEQNQVATQIGGRGLEKVEWPPIRAIGWEDLIYNDEGQPIGPQKMVWHKKENIFFMQDGTCSEHGLLFSQHDNPFVCEKVKLMAAYTLSNILDLDILYHVVENATLMYHYKNDKCDEKPHQWRMYEFYRVEQENVYFDVLKSETCIDCEANRSISNLPLWLHDLFADDIYDVQWSHSDN